MKMFEKMLVAIDRTVVGAIYRFSIGFLLIPVQSRLRLNVRSKWELVFSLLVVLFSLRIVPAVVRKLISFPSSANAIWSERRKIAKLYDSYQWQKLFFIGAGLACYTFLSRQWLGSWITVSSFCVVGGALGLVRWYSQRASVRNSLVHKYVL